ncbi:hypothetical protein SNE40_006522 [Patella caerulea]|uniref:SOCS box domain-containing protein n=1 Tax=Patella caerulea TaxID=87958 RepID=A0AAN8K3W9_PATCE
MDRTGGKDRQRRIFKQCGIDGSSEIEIPMQAIIAQCLAAVESYDLCTLESIFSEYPDIVNGNHEVCLTLIKAIIRSDSVTMMKLLESKGIQVLDSLRECVESEKLELVKYFLYGENSKYRIPWHMNQDLIYIAVQKKNKQLFTCLLNSEASHNIINYMDPLSGFTALHYCLETVDHYRFVEPLVYNGADVNMPTATPRKRTPLMMAAENGLTETFMYLLQKGAKLTRTKAGDPLLMMIANDDKENAYSLIRSGFDVNARLSKNVTYLMAAVELKKIEMAELLIYRGEANVNAVDDDNRTAFGHCRANLGDMAKLLLENKIQCSGGEIFWFLSRDNKSLDLILRYKEQLYDNNSIKVHILNLPRDTDLGAAFNNMQLSFDNTDVSVRHPPDMSLSMLKNSELLMMLVERGVTLNLKDEDGYTPLMKAAPKNDTTALKLLLVAGADPNITHQSGQTVLNYLNIYDYVKRLGDCIKLLLYYGGPQLSLAVNNDGLTFLETVLVSDFPTFSYFLVLDNYTLEDTSNIKGVSFGEDCIKVGFYLYQNGLSYGAVADLFGEETRKKFHKFCLPFNNLKNQCRRAIRRAMGPGIQKSIRKLDLPLHLHRYILLKDIAVDHLYYVDDVEGQYIDDDGDDGEYRYDKDVGNLSIDEYSDDDDNNSVSRFSVEEGDNNLAVVIIDNPKYETEV